MTKSEFKTVLLLHELVNRGSAIVVPPISPHLFLLFKGTTTMFCPPFLRLNWSLPSLTGTTPVLFWRSSPLRVMKGKDREKQVKKKNREGKANSPSRFAKLIVRQEEE